MTTLAGTRALLALALRRDRVLLPACVLGVVLLVAVTAGSFTDLYPTAAERAKFAATIEGSAAFSAIYGRTEGLDSVGGLVSWRLLATGSTIVALMSLLMVVRHTRGEEERGQTELVLGGAVGRHAPIAAALALVWAMDAVIAAGSAVALIASGLPAAGSIAFGLAIAAAGFVFAPVGVIGAQIASTARAARALAGAALAGAFLLRAAGDAGTPALSWLSPVGGGQALRPFDDERFWPLLLTLAATLVCTAAGAALLDRRDLGSGLLAARPGPLRAGARLTTPLGFALRLQRASLIGWTAGLLLVGVVIGAVGNGAADLLKTSSTVEDLFSRGGAGALTDQFYASVLVLIALIAAGATVQAGLRLHGEEAAGCAEPVLATAIGRTRWAVTHLGLSMVAAVLTLAAAGVGLGAASAIGSGEAAQFPRLLGAALAQVPAVWVVGGATALLWGLAPRAVAWAAWTVLVVFTLFWFAGPLLDPPGWVLDLSPFTHVPAAPAVTVTAGPLLALTAVAALLTVVGLAGWRRRDLAG